MVSWLFSHKQFIAWAIFTEELIAHYEDTKRNTFFSQLISLKQKGSIMKHIEEFQKLNIRVKDIPKEHRIDCWHYDACVVLDGNPLIKEHLICI